MQVPRSSGFHFKVYFGHKVRKINHSAQPMDKSARKSVWMKYCPTIDYSTFAFFLPYEFIIMNNEYMTAVKIQTIILKIGGNK